MAQFGVSLLVAMRQEDVALLLLGVLTSLLCPTLRILLVVPGMHIRACRQPADLTAAASAVLAGDPPASALSRADQAKLGMAAGQSIAVACGRFDIQGWCSQPGLLAVWNLARSGLDPSRPGHALEVDTCLQCCSYHPEHPVSVLCCRVPSLLMQCRHTPVRRLDWAAGHMQTAIWLHRQHSLLSWAAALRCRHSVLLGADRHQFISAQS